MSKVLGIRMDEALIERLDHVRRVVSLQDVLAAVADSFDRLRPKESGPFLYALRHAGHGETITPPKAISEGLREEAVQDRGRYFRLGRIAAYLQMVFRSYLLEPKQYFKDRRSVAMPTDQLDRMFDSNGEIEWLKTNPTMKADLFMFFAREPSPVYDKFKEWIEKN